MSLRPGSHAGPGFPTDQNTSAQRAHPNPPAGWGRYVAMADWPPLCEGRNRGQLGSRHFPTWQNTEPSESRATLGGLPGGGCLFQAGGTRSHPRAASLSG